MYEKERFVNALTSVPGIDLGLSQSGIVKTQNKRVSGTRKPIIVCSRRGLFLPKLFMISPPVLCVCLTDKCVSQHRQN